MQQKGAVAVFLAAEAKYSDDKQNAKAVVTEKFTDSAKASMRNRRLIQSNGDWKIHDISTCQDLLIASFLLCVNVF